MTRDRNPTSEAARRLDPWRNADLDQELGRVHRSVRRRHAIRHGGAAAIILAAAVALAIWQPVVSDHSVLAVRAPAPAPITVPDQRTPPPDAGAAPIVVHPREPSLLRLEDGTRVVPLDDDAELTATAVGPKEVRLRLAAGQAHFEVPTDRDRVVEIDVAPIRVQVYGAEFSAAHQEGQVAIDVWWGDVSITWPGGHAVLKTGGRGVFPPRATKDRPGPVVQRRAPTVPDPIAVADEVEDLLRAADNARISGHPEEAIGHLRRIVDGYRNSGDPRAAIAAFTLGRVLLDTLRRPAEAAAAFATAREMSPSGPLAEDSLAREVEAWALVGNTARAADRAREYIVRYPRGTRVDMVRRRAGLE